MISKMIKILIFSLTCCIFFVQAGTDCLLRETEYGLVCVCSASYCDYLENPEPTADNVVVVSTSKQGLRFAVKNLPFGNNKNNNNGEESSSYNSGEKFDNELKFLKRLLKTKETLPQQLFPKNAIILNVNRSVEYQKIAGFGGAFTGSVSYVLGLIDVELQDQIYRSYFHKDGIGFTMLRMPIGGCDFDLEPWAYNEEPKNDVELSNFTQLDPRDEVKVQQLNRLKLVAELEDLKIMAVTWSPPVWMKTNGKWDGFSMLKEEYYQTWADYHLRFIELMNAKNMPIWAISTGNEPLNGILVTYLARFMSLGWLPNTQGIWVNDFLGPTMRNSKYKDVLIFGNDDRRITFPSWFLDMNETRPGVLNYVDGLSATWYWDDYLPILYMDITVQLMPGKILLNTESALSVRPQPGSWQNGATYARSFLTYLKSSYNGFIDWIIVVDEQGGPNYFGLLIDAPVIVNITSGMEIYKSPRFYAMGHFSKFVPEGSVHIEADVVSSNGTSVEAIAFKRPDERIAVVLLNGDEDPVDIILNDSVQGEIKINLPPNSWHTIIYS